MATDDDDAQRQLRRTATGMAAVRPTHVLPRATTSPVGTGAPKPSAVQTVASPVGTKVAPKPSAAHTVAFPMGARATPLSGPTVVVLAAALPDATSALRGERRAPSAPAAARGARANDDRTEQDSRPPLDFSRRKRIGRFELIREIARGGMGQVFLGRDTKLGRKVAIKFLLRDDPHFVQRFVVEARATARCEHENIVTIYEVGEHEGLPYMVLEYLEGKTLSEVLETKPSLRQFVELMVPVARALERATEHGIVHRDLKPSNIFVTARGQVKVLDFGVARLTERAEADIARASAAMGAVSPDDGRDSSVTFTGSNSVVGTLPYMSPEQWGTAPVDHQSDIWAIGIMFWRVLTGIHPAGTMHPERLRERLCDLGTPLPSIATRDPGLPGEIVAIVDKCLAKRKHDRYANATALLVDLQAFLAPKTHRPSVEVCPYRGLAAFCEDDAPYFFGRSNEIRTALAQLETWPLLAVIGPSGVGKSSFVHAGLVPALRENDGSWQVAMLRPGRLPLHRLASVLEDAVATGETAQSLMGQLVESPGLFGVMLREAATRRNQQFIVVVDQLEELFTLCDSDDIRRTFLAALLAAADDTTAPVRVVLSMRADFLDRLAGHKHFLSELSRGLFFLSAPDRENLRDTLLRPAELAGYAFEDPRIVDDMMQAATSRGGLPLVSFAAMRLWDSRDIHRKLLTVAAYHQMGGVGGAFAGHADQIASAVAPQSQILLRALMTRLVTPEGTRAVLDPRELLGLSPDPREVERILDQLVRGRLIHMHTDPSQGPTVEIVHEMLINAWPTMRRWLDESQAIRAFMSELRQAARQWAARGKAVDLVWRGATAQEALGHAARQLLDLSVVEREFLDAVGAQVRRTRRRKVLAFTAIFTALGLVIAGGSLALVKIKLAESEARERAAEAVKALDETKQARDVAQKSQKQAEVDRAAAVAATGQLQEKLDIIERERQQRLVAEQQVAAARHGEEMSKEQLAEANAALERKVAETQAAKEKAQANETVAKKATEEAKAAKRELEKLLAAQRAEIDKLKARKKDIIDLDLNSPGGRK